MNNKKEFEIDPEYEIVNRIIDTDQASNMIEYREREKAFYKQLLINIESGKDIIGEVDY